MDQVSVTDYFLTFTDLIIYRRPICKVFFGIAPYFKRKKPGTIKRKPAPQKIHF